MTKSKNSTAIEAKRHAAKVELRRAWLFFIIFACSMLIAAGMKQWVLLILGFAIGSFRWVWGE